MSDAIIIIPGQRSEEETHRRDRYEKDPDVRARADYIHERRMLPPPTCDQCIELALTEIDGV